MTKQHTKEGNSRRKARKIMNVCSSLWFVHHKDGNPLNNDRNNLVIMSPKEHSNHHGVKTRLKNIDRLLRKWNADLY